MFRDIAVNPPTVRALLLAGLAMMLGSPDTRANIVIDPDNILVTYFQSIREYTRDGTLVQSIPVPYPDEPRPGTEWLKDVAMLADGRMAVFNGTFSPYMSIFNPASNSWSHSTVEGWRVGNNVGLSGIGAYGTRVFANDQDFVSFIGDEGMVVFDADTGTGNRFEPRFGTRDVNIGADGKLYSIGARFVSQDSIYVYDPITLEMERTLAHPNEVNPTSVAADADGNIYIVQSHQVRKTAPNGDLIEIINLPTFFSSDIDIAPDGTVLIGSHVDGVFITDLSFSEYTQIPVPGNARVGFAFGIPEPSSLLLLLAFSSLAIGFRRPRCLCCAAKQV
jgi:hypothetical protein